MKFILVSMGRGSDTMLLIRYENSKDLKITISSRRNESNDSKMVEKIIQEDFKMEANIQASK